MLSKRRTELKVPFKPIHRHRRIESNRNRVLPRNDFGDADICQFNELADADSVFGGISKHDIAVTQPVKSTSL